VGGKLFRKFPCFNFYFLKIHSEIVTEFSSRSLGPPSANSNLIAYSDKNQREVDV